MELVRRLHCAVLILGVFGFFITIIVGVLILRNTNLYTNSGNGPVVWLPLSTVALFVSGLMGLLITGPDTLWFFLHLILEILNLINLLILIVAFVGNAFWIIYFVASSVCELWATVLRLQHCCTKRENPPGNGRELQVVNPSPGVPVRVPVPAQVSTRETVRIFFESITTIRR